MRRTPLLILALLVACTDPPGDPDRDSGSEDGTDARVTVRDGGRDRDGGRTDRDGGPRPDGGFVGGDGEVGSYADMDLGAHPIYSIDMGIGDYGIHYNGVGVGTGTSTHHDSGWWDGGAFSRMTPPTEDGLERGIAINDIWRGGSIAIQEVNLRFEWRGSPTLGSQWISPKFLISHYRLDRTVGDAQTRPMLFAAEATASDDRDYYRENTWAFAPAQGTTQAWGPEGYFDSYPPLYYYPEGPQAFYMADEGDTLDGFIEEVPLFAISEIVTMEMRVISVSTDEFPEGLIGLRVYRRNGDEFERSAPYTIDDNEPLGAYLMEFQQFGCGQYNSVPTPSADLYMDVGGHITIARDLNGWLGPREGFVE
jgi:hypothetical protein